MCCCLYGDIYELCWTQLNHRLAPTFYWHHRKPSQQLLPDRYSVHWEREKIKKQTFKIDLEWKRRKKDSVVWSGSSGGGKEPQIWEVLRRLNQPTGFPTEYDSKVRDPSNWVMWGATDCHGQCGWGVWEGKLEVWSGTCQREMLLTYPGGMSSGQLAHMSDLQRLKDHIPLWVLSAEWC